MLPCWKRAREGVEYCDKQDSFLVTSSPCKIKSVKEGQYFPISCWVGRFEKEVTERSAMTRSAMVGVRKIFRDGGVTLSPRKSYLKTLFSLFFFNGAENLMRKSERRVRLTSDWHDSSDWRVRAEVAGKESWMGRTRTAVRDWRNPARMDPGYFGVRTRHENCWKPWKRHQDGTYERRRRGRTRIRWRKWSSSNIFTTSCISSGFEKWLRDTKCQGGEGQCRRQGGSQQTCEQKFRLPKESLIIACVV